MAWRQDYRENEMNPGGSDSPGFSTFFTVLNVLLVGSILLGGYTLFASLSGAAALDREVKLPDYVRGAGAVHGAEIAYQGAVDIPEVMSQIPCFCGCSLASKHRSNLDCFIEFRNSDRIDFDSHGATCSISVDIALDTIAWHEEGIGTDEIRDMIVDKYALYGIYTD